MGSYGKSEASLQFEPALAAAVFRELHDSGLVPPGYYRDYLDDSARWLSGETLEACDAGRYSIAIDASGNVAPCLAHPHAGNLRERPLDEILSAFDRDAIRRCSDASGCNLLCSRVIGRGLRHPVSGLQTLLRMRRA